MRQHALERLPVLSVIERNVKGILRPQVEQPLAHGVFANTVRVAQRSVGNSVGNRRPGLAVIRRLVNEGIAIIHLMEIHG